MENTDILLEIQIICIAYAMWVMYNYILNRDKRDK